MISRNSSKKLIELASYFKVVAVTGPRQSGKTTLVRAIFPDKPYVTLEDPDQRIFALEDPRGFLSTFPEGAILDEVQRTPELFSYLQGVVDFDPNPGQFILTGSNNFLLQQSITQSLAGRVGYLQLLPFSLSELYPVAANIPGENSLILKGGYPPLYAPGIPIADLVIQAQRFNRVSAPIIYKYKIAIFCVIEQIAFARKQNINVVLRNSCIDTTKFISRLHFSGNIFPACSFKAGTPMMDPVYQFNLMYLAWAGLSIKYMNFISLNYPLTFWFIFFTTIYTILIFLGIGRTYIRKNWQGEDSCA